MAAKLSINLRPASFRGVPFQVDATDLGAGRRTTVHEYPQRDKPWVEDLGRAAREISFDAFVVGPDYVDQANRLLAALEEGGSGTLIHPWLGTLTVSVKDLGRITFSRELGYAKFSLSLVEAGELTFPAAGASTAAQSRLAAANIQTAAVNDFAKKFNVNGYQDFVASDASKGVSGAIGQVASGQVPGLSALGFAERSVSTLNTAQGLLGSPRNLGLTIARFLNVSDYAQAGLRWETVAQSLTRLASVPGLGVPTAPQSYTPSRLQSYNNLAATNALTRQLVLAQAVGASSLVGAGVYDDTVGLRNQLTAALDAESLNASDESYIALQEARSKVWQDLTQRSRDGARLTTKTPAETTPAVVLAYDYYEDAGRADDIVARNRLRHPGFVPPAPLRVLTR